MALVPSSAESSVPRTAVPSESTGGAEPGRDDLPPHWRLRRPDPDAVVRLVTTERVPEVLARILVNRGHETSGAASTILSPSLHALHDPAGLPEIDRAAERLVRAIESGETVLVHGDYDVDGVSGTVLLVRFLRTLGANAEWHIPHRTRDGYSFGDHSVAKARETGATLVISVDNGTSAVEPIAALVEAGVDVIVTDHHEPPPDGLPPAYALVNPKLETSRYPFRELCGTGVAFKLAWATCQRLSGGEKVRPDLRAFLIAALGYVAIATVCDVVPLVDENRVLASFGLRSLSESPSPGMLALLDRIGLTGRALTAEDVGFQIGPRINASGRMDSAARAVEALLADDAIEGRRHAETLERLNDERRAVERGVVEEALEQAECYADPDAYPILVLGGDGWHPGVVGIVASRMVDRYGRPALIIGIEDGVGRGSARSVPGVDVLSILRGGADLMTRFGGHAMAAGCEIRPENVDALRDALVRAAKGVPRSADVQPIDIDASVRLEGFDVALMRQLERMEPCGNGNPQAVLLAEDVRLEEMPRIIGRDQTHLLLQVRSGTTVLKALAFGMADRVHELQMSRPLDLVFRPRLSHWRGRTELELVLVDFWCR
ncbi:MAG: single-stranded-DNA-specific exonuclease RecJ [Planctomycetota bacterium]